jgi:hypothetical protein
MSKAQVLANLVPQIIQENNREKGEMYQDIFLEIGKNNVKTIVESNDKQILSILLDLMSIGTPEEMIRARYQTPFWKDFIKHISSIGSEAYKFEKLQAF